MAKLPWWLKQKESFNGRRYTHYRFDIHPIYLFWIGVKVVFKSGLWWVLLKGAWGWSWRKIKKPL